jgi:hypothetical protein
MDDAKRQNLHPGPLSVPGVTHHPQDESRQVYVTANRGGPLADPARALAVRSLPAALAGFRAGVPKGAKELLEELSQSDLTLANLYLRAIVEEVPDMSMVGEALQPDMFERLRELESFREYEARVEAKAKAEAEREVTKTVAAQRAADAARGAADAARAAAEARTQSKVETRADDLIEFLSLHGGIPSDRALTQIRACTDSVVLGIWLRRAYQGETAADIFPST